MKRSHACHCKDNMAVQSLNSLLRQQIYKFQPVEYIKTINHKCCQVRKGNTGPEY